MNVSFAVRSSVNEAKQRLLDNIKKIAENFGICEKGTYEQVEKMLIKHNLPIKYDITAKQLCDAALSDKKRGGEKITLVLPEKIGKCILYDVNVADLQEIFSKAL